MKFELVLLSAAFFCVATGQDDWGYGDTDGPSTWSAQYPQCGGKQQSPIALDPNTTTYADAYPFNWCDGYDAVPNSMTLTNTGHDVSLKGVWDVPPCIRAIIGVYYLNSIHWHWSSEHTILGERYALEMQMVFTIQGDANVKTVVLALLFKESNSGAGIPGLAKVVDNIQYVRDANTSTDIKPFPITELLVYQRLPVFFGYQGSLTTPPCNESVFWVVEENPSGVSSSQLSTFRTLRDKEGNTLQKNYRPLQPINGRSVFYPSQ